MGSSLRWDRTADWHEKFSFLNAPAKRPTAKSFAAATAHRRDCASAYGPRGKSRANCRQLSERTRDSREPSPRTPAPEEGTRLIILGLNAFHADSAAALVRDGVLIAAAEEERFRRVKHWAGFPSQAIGYCLREAGCEFQ